MSINRRIEDLERTIAKTDAREPSSGDHSAVLRELSDDELIELEGIRTRVDNGVAQPDDLERARCILKRGEEEALKKQGL